MATLRERVLKLIEENPGLTDREITDAVVARGAPRQAVNQVCHSLESSQHVARRRRTDGRIGNFPGERSDLPRTRAPAASVFQQLDPLSEDCIKSALQTWLELHGWRVTVASGRARGTDVEAVRDVERWIVEVKGRGSLNPIRVNYFLAVLGEVLQRMSDPAARYSIALPDLAQFRGWWSRLPRLAKERTHITALFVDESGHVVEID